MWSKRACQAMKRLQRKREMGESREEGDKHLPTEVEKG